MNVKILKIATCAVIFGAISSKGSASDDGGAAGMALDSITTISGKVYREIELISADDHGLLFRHSKGTAKEDFENLNFALREMFEPDVRIPEMDAALEKEAATDASNGKGDDAVVAAAEDEEEVDESIEIYTRTRVYLYPQRQPQLLWWVQPAWLPQWSRYQGAHAASYFTNRQLIEQDFLISSGLVKPPCGVTVRRLPRRGY